DPGPGPGPETCSITLTSGSDLAGPGLVSDEREQPHGAGAAADPVCGDAVTSYCNTAADPAATTDFSQQVYQDTSPAVTSYSSQGSFPPLVQSTVYSSFPQSGQTYGLPPFGALWPGIKTEAGLPAAPSGGQSGFLSFSTAFTPPPPGQLHYSYPSQGELQLLHFTSSAHQNQTRFLPLVFCVSSLELHHVQRVLQRPVGNCRHHGLHGSRPPDALPPENLPAGAALPTGAARDQDELSRRSSVGKAKGKAKKSDSSLPADSDLERIFLWDLDETIIIFHSLLTGTFAQKFGKDPTTVLNLGLQMEELIFELADTHLFFNDLEECDQVHIEDVASDDNGQDLSNYNFLSDGFNGPGAGTASGSAAGVQGGVEWMRKLAFRYRRLKEIYSGYKGNVGGESEVFRRNGRRALTSV
uniref:Eyes absent homolog n=1 Tax=Nothobranchius furzeri TaxID=105023 RepID=A0A8C6P6J8_NOTFU